MKVIIGNPDETEYWRVDFKRGYTENDMLLMLNIIADNPNDNYLIVHPDDNEKSDVNISSGFYNKITNRQKFIARARQILQEENIPNINFF